MLTPSIGTLADYNTSILNGNATHVRLVFPSQNITLTDDDISASGGLRISTVLNPDTDLTMGRAISTELTVQLLNSATFTGFDWTEEFHVDFGVEQSGVTNWVTVGYFKGKKPERLLRTEVIEFVAYDRMQLFDTIADDYLSTITYPATMQEIYDDLCSYIGVTNVVGDDISDAMGVSYAESPFVNGITCRALLAMIAEANGCYARIDASGNVKLVWFSDQTSAYSVDGDDYFNINVDESNAPAIDGIRVSCTEDDTANFTYPLNANVYYQSIDNPLLLAMGTNDITTVLTDIIARFSAFGSYRPVSVDIVGNWMVEVGDIIEVWYDNGSTLNLPIFSRTLSWNGGCGDVYECTGKTDRTELTESAKEQYQTGGQLANKYTIRSGVDITEDGVTISGGKWLKLISGGVLDVQSTNFTISSADKKMVCGNWTFNDAGLHFQYENLAHDVLTFDINKHPTVGNAFQIATRYSTIGTSDVGISIYHSRVITPNETNPACFILPLNKSVLNILGIESNQYDQAWFKQYNGDGVANNLTETDAGKVLDARQGKALNDKFADYVATANIANNLTTTASGKVLDARQGKTLNDSKVNGVREGWGTSLVGNGFHHGILLIDAANMYLVWFNSTSTITVRNFRDSSWNKSASGTVTFGITSSSDSDITIKREDEKITITTTQNRSIALFYM